MNRLITCLVSVFLFTNSCGKKEEHKHIPKKDIVDLETLVRSVNQSVLSNVSTFNVKDTTIAPVIHATGVISYNPNLAGKISTRYGGRIEKLYVRFKFQEVRKGQRIMDIYSPEILNEQHNLILLVKSPDTENMLEASIEKLKLLGLTKDQVNQIIKTQKVINPLPVYSPYTGHIHDLTVSQSSNGSTMATGDGMNSSMSSNNAQSENTPATVNSSSNDISLQEGMYIQKGQSVLSVFELSNLWAIIKVYQKDASQIKVGNKVQLTAETAASDSIDATVNYIEPLLKGQTSINVRVYLNNQDKLRFKIGSIVTAKLYSEPIHSYWIPRESSVDLGNRQIVFVLSNNHFEARQITVGLRTDKYIQVTEGLITGELVAANAQYLVDSESFINPDSK